MQRAILHEQALWLHRSGPGLFVGHFLLTFFDAWILWDHTELRSSLVDWVIATTLVLVLRWIELIRFRRDQKRNERGLYWMRLFTVGAALSGVVWGYAGWHFADPELGLFPLGLALAVLIALSVPTAGVYFPAHAYFNLLAMTPFLVLNMMMGERLYWAQSAGLLALMGGCLYFAYRQQSTIVDAIRLRHENLDLVQRLANENELVEQARRQAEQANSAKSRFLAAASHDLRQPLQAVNLFVQALVEDNKLNRPPEPSYLNKLISAAESLQSMLDSLLDLSQAESGKLKAEIRHMPLQPLFDRLRREFSDQARAKGLRLRVVSTHAHVQSDPALLERMLRNLVTNALRYTECGSVLIACRRAGAGVRIEVRDSGVGIPEAAQSAIFQEFHQLGNPERDRRKGLGLGLAIVHALAQQLGHRINVRSAPARGSVFSIELLRGESRPEAAQENHRSFDSLAGRLVALIDDDPLVIDGMVSLLTRWHCRVVHGENAQQIIAALHGQGTAPAAILADWRLREDRNGIDEVRQLCAQLGREIPALIITGDVAVAQRELDLPVLRKPVRGFQLRAQLDALLRRENLSAQSPE